MAESVTLTFVTDETHKESLSEDVTIEENTITFPAGDHFHKWEPRTEAHYYCLPNGRSLVYWIRDDTLDAKELPSIWINAAPFVEVRASAIRGLVDDYNEQPKARHQIAKLLKKEFRMEFFLNEQGSYSAGTSQANGVIENRIDGKL